MAPEQTGRVNRSIDPDRPLLTRLTFYEMLTVAFRHGIRSDGMGGLPRRSQPAAPGERQQCASSGVRYHDEAALEDGKGSLSDRGGGRERSAALPSHGNSEGASTTSRPAITPDRLIIPRSYTGGTGRSIPCLPCSAIDESQTPGRRLMMARQPIAPSPSSLPVKNGESLARCRFHWMVRFRPLV